MGSSIGEHKCLGDSASLEEGDLGPEVSPDGILCAWIERWCLGVPPTVGKVGLKKQKFYVSVLFTAAEAAELGGSEAVNEHQRGHTVHMMLRVKGCSTSQVCNPKPELHLAGKPHVAKNVFFFFFFVEA